MDLLAGDSVETAAKEVALAENGRGAGHMWLEPMRGEMLDVPDDGDGGGSAPAPALWEKRGLFGRLRSWWEGRIAARRMGALRREGTHVGGR